MSFRYRSDDDIVEIVVDPAFRGDLAGLARTRVVYIVETSQNKLLIDDCLKLSKEVNLCEVNRLETEDPENREGNFLDALPLVDLHQYPYRGFVVHGTPPSASVTSLLAERKISIMQTADGFSASIAENAPAQGLWALTESLKDEKSE